MLNASSTLKSAFCKNYKIISGQMLTGPWCILINQTIGLSYSKWKACWKIVKLKNFFRNYFVGRLGTKCDVSYIAEKMETYFNVETWTLDSWYFSSLAHSPKHIFLSKGWCHKSCYMSFKHRWSLLMLFLLGHSPSSETISIFYKIIKDSSTKNKWRTKHQILNDWSDLPFNH